MTARPLALLAALAACSAPTFSAAPASPAYAPMPALQSLRDTSRQRSRLESEDRRLRAGAPPAATALHDAVEQIVGELGEACAPRNPGGDGFHWTIGCATETLFAPGISTPSNPEVAERWRAVGRILGNLLRRPMPGSPRLRLAVSGFADHIRFANPAAARCDELTTFWNATYPAPADEASLNRALSFCRAATMAREIACAMTGGPCTRDQIERSAGLSVGVFGGGTTRLDAAPTRFRTRLGSAPAAIECACHAVSPTLFGSRWTTLHGPSAPAACPAETPSGEAPALFDCDGARRVELDLWLEVTPGATPANQCAVSSSEPDARALACLQDAVGAAAHQHDLRPPVVRPAAPRCADPRPPEGWFEAHAGARPPCVAELSE